DAHDDVTVLETVINIIGSGTELDTILQDVKAGSENLLGGEGEAEIQIYSAPSREGIIDRLNEPELESENALLYHGENLDYFFQISDGTINLLRITAGDI